MQNFFVTNPQFRSQNACFKLKPPHFPIKWGILIDAFKHIIKIKLIQFRIYLKAYFVLVKTHFWIFWSNFLELENRRTPKVPKSVLKFCNGVFSVKPKYLAPKMFRKRNFFSKYRFEACSFAQWPWPRRFTMKNCRKRHFRGCPKVLQRTVYRNGKKNRIFSLSWALDRSKR